MATTNSDTYPHQDNFMFANYSTEEASWFPTNPDCPNHTIGAPFSTAYANPNTEGHVSCAECFLHSTIVQSMTQPCHHLHACSNCADCYSQNLVNSPPGGAAEESPPLFPCGSPQGPGLSPPMLSGSPHQPLRNSGSYGQASPLPAATFYTPVNSPVSQPRRTSLPLQHEDVYSNTGVQSPNSYSSPSTPYQVINDFSASRSPFDIARNALSPSLCELSPASTMQSLSPVPKETNYSSTPLMNTKDRNKPTSQVSKEKNDITSNRKRGPNDVCEVCGDRASGYHYNALTCEGCKGFFRRSINKKEVPNKCKYGGNCEMDTYTRRKCPDCRLRKCKAVGMLEECLLTEIQCQSKRRSRKPKKVVKDATNIQTSSAQTQLNSQSLQSNPASSGIRSSRGDANHKTTDPPRLSERQIMINQIGTAFTEYRSHPEIVKRWTSFFIKDELKGSASLIELATVHVQVFVEFVKKLPGFSRVTSEDQIALLKGSVVSVMILRNSRGYNLKKDHINVVSIIKKLNVKMEHFRIAQDLFSHIDSLKLDDTEYGLLLGVIIFDSDHPHITDKVRIDRYRDMYLSALSDYCKSRKPLRFNIFAKILFLNTKLRTLQHLHADVISNMKANEQLTPLLYEIYDGY